MFIKVLFLMFAIRPSPLDEKKQGQCPGVVCVEDNARELPFFYSGVATARRKLLCGSSEKSVAIPGVFLFKSITRINSAKCCQEGRGNRFFEGFL
jgi:hypothetical protein